MALRTHAFLLTLAGCAVLPAPTFASVEPGYAQMRSLREEARAYEHGEGVAKDPAKAVQLYCEGATAAGRYAAIILARDDAIAAYFFNLAAEQGHEPSRNMLRFVGAATSEIPECMREKKVVTEEPDDFEYVSEKQRQLAELVRRLAPEYGIEPRLALAIARTESNFNPNAVSVKNAQGLMQLIPETAVRFNVKKPFDPEQNVRGGLAYLRWLLAYFRGDVALAAAGYNAGEGAVNRFLGIPPYAETRGYVQRILATFRRHEHPYDAAVTEPSPELPRILQRKTRIKS